MASGITVVKALMEDGKRIRERERNGEWGPWKSYVEVWTFPLRSFFNREWEIEGAQGMNGIEAIQAMQDGKTVERPFVENGKMEGIYQLEEGTPAWTYWVRIVRTGKEPSPWNARMGLDYEEIHATNWRLVSEVAPTIRTIQLQSEKAQVEGRHRDPCGTPSTVGEESSGKYPKILVWFAADLFARDENVQSIHGMMVGSKMHVWIVVRENTLATRYVAYTAQLKTDPDFLLRLYFTESLNAVPDDAERVVSR